MHYKGYDGHDAWLALDELQAKAKPEISEMDVSGLKKGMRLQAEADGTFWAAEAF